MAVGLSRIDGVAIVGVRLRGEPFTLQAAILGVPFTHTTWAMLLDDHEMIAAGSIAPAGNLFGRHERQRIVGAGFLGFLGPERSQPFAIGRKLVDLVGRCVGKIDASPAIDLDITRSDRGGHGESKFELSLRQARLQRHGTDSLTLARSMQHPEPIAPASHDTDRFGDCDLDESLGRGAVQDHNLVNAASDLFSATAGQPFSFCG